MTTASKFRLEISLDNDAFKPEACIEIAGILQHVARALEFGGEPALEEGQLIHDRKGNHVGFWEAT